MVSKAATREMNNGPDAALHARLVLALLVRLPVVLHTKRFSATSLTR